MFLISNENLSIILLLCTIIPIGFLIILAFVLRLRNASIAREKSKKIISGEEVDQDQKTAFEEAYGGKDNIVSLNIERNKLYVKVKSIDEVDGEKLKELGAQNVLLIGDEVRSSFGDRAEYVYNLLK